MWGSPPIGCEFGDGVLRVAQVREASGPAPSIVCATCDVAPGTDDAALGRSLRELIKANGFRGSAAVASLPPPDVMRRTLRLSPMGEAELATAAHFMAAKELSLQPTSIKSAVIPLGTVKQQQGGAKSEVVAVVAKLEALHKYAGVMLAAGLTPVAVDDAPAAVARCLTLPLPSRPSAAAPLLVLDVGAGSTTMTVASGGHVKLLHVFAGGHQRVRELLGQRLKVAATGIPADIVISADKTDRVREFAELHDVAPDVVEEALPDAWRIATRELAREITLLLHHYTDDLSGASPAQAVLRGAGGRQNDVVAALEELTQLGFHDPAEIVGPAWCDAFGEAGDVGQWVAAAGLSLYGSAAQAAAERRSA